MLLYIKNLVKREFAHDFNSLVLCGTFPFIPFISSTTYMNCSSFLG